MADDRTYTGISNRETPSEEEMERQSFPIVHEGSPPPEDAGGSVGDEDRPEVPNRHTAHKAGSRSVAQKEDASKYADRSMPQTRHVPGAFGREPNPGSVPGLGPEAGTQ